MKTLTKGCITVAGVIDTASPFNVISKELFNKLKEDYGVVLPDTDTAPFEIVKSLKHELILGQLRLMDHEDYYNFPYIISSEPESEMSKLSSSDSDSKPDLALKE
ncbi:6972_t:CDS:2 [Entrophospora sp. SA101]|nr:4049_t:CDS:2 [Entrophospora sp. SA101]CAJ0760003.1 11402_t:CDS:2 [Entrophospora sp. SA101]CAJ0760600.1 6970_t:CDS:2 [Entrophospora sp. SA101]CAJ0760602.1 6972_t:CDS:2 [Entrophospora sp. SA101]CAJ0910977.1 20116_t:CDS:2 [Entrophospora sp. SA101]